VIFRAVTTAHEQNDTAITSSREESNVRIVFCPTVLFTLTRLPYWVGLHGERQNGKRYEGNPFGFFGKVFCGSQEGGGWAESCPCR
jgi:hypothetical protein